MSHISFSWVDPIWFKYIAGLALETFVWDFGLAFFQVFSNKQKMHPFIKTVEWIIGVIVIRHCWSYPPQRILREFFHTILPIFSNKSWFLSFSQFGFRAKDSNTDGVGELLVYLQKIIDVRKKPIAKFLSLKKTFNAVNHDRFFCTLHSLNRLSTIFIFKIIS